MSTGEIAEPVTEDRTRHQVLIVDDDVLTRSVMAELLRDAGLIVLECGDADEALAVLLSGTAVALLFSDIRMPGSMDGVGLARTVSRDYPDLKIILTSSERPPDDACCHAFFGKPWDLVSVVTKVKSLLAG